MPIPRTIWAISAHEIPTGNREHNLALAIECYQQALRFYTPESDPHRYATVQNNLGNAYAEQPTGDRARNLALAIECYQQALRFRIPRDRAIWIPKDSPQPG